MQKTLNYLFDPLCGWCYGAGPAISALAEEGGVTLAMQPTGLFSTGGTRLMDEEFAAYAWANDQRISRLTGQPFSERYREQVLGNRKQLFDSGPATLALSAVALAQPEAELQALKAIQAARYVDGLDVTNPKILREVLEGLDLHAAAAMFGAMAGQLLTRNGARVAAAQEMMRRFGLRGVPALILDDGQRKRPLDANLMFGEPGALRDSLANA